MLVGVMRRDSLAEAEILSSAEKRALVSRVAASDAFRKAPRLREFFGYVAECTIAQRLDDVREQVIADKVFQRKVDYYELQDSIVRAEARNLRRRLDQYFETEGAAEPIVVSMPKGGYALCFSRRLALTSAEIVESKAPALSAEGVPVPVQAALAEPLATGLGRSGGYQAACAILSLIAVIAVGFACHWRAQAREATLPGAWKENTTAFPFPAVFSSGRDTLVVTSDTAVLQMLQISGKRVSLNDYIVRAYPPLPHVSPPNLQAMLNRFEYTDGNETALAGSILRKNAALIRRTYLRSGHEVQLSDFKGNNVILIGSPLSNPWAQLYAERLDFQFELEAGRGIVLRNPSPRRGERAEYPAPGDAEHHWAYARLALLPPEAENGGAALLIAGTSAAATAAAGEFMLDDQRVAAALKQAGINPFGLPRYFELVLRATTFSGGATKSEVIATRR